MSDVPNAKYKPTWRAYWFNIVGWFVCAWNGKLDRYAWLVAQSAVETKAWTSNIFLKTGNGFGMKAPTKHMSGTYTTTTGTYAKYRFYYQSWIARLEWDAKRNIQCKTGEAYVDAVCAAGYAEDEHYKATWVGVYYALPKVVRGMSVQFQSEGMGPLSIFGYLLAVSIVLALLYALWLLIRTVYKACKR